MLKLRRFLADYKPQLIIGPLCKLFEAVLELFAPLVMAAIIDNGILKNNTDYVLKMGAVLVLLGVVGLSSALVCQYMASYTSQGAGTKIRSALFEHIGTLSHKELLGTWEENAALFSAGQTVSGVIRSVEEYGVFVELTPNLAGLAEPRSDAAVGQQASVYIKSIIREKMKIKLIIIDSFEADFSPPLHYFYDGDVLEEWEYSPAECRKRISTRFCG